MSGKEIHSRDVQWLTDSDVVIAEVTTTSLGVGYELGIAESLQKKILCLHREPEGKRLSAMIAGNPKFIVRSYKDIGELDEIFVRFFAGELD